MHSKYYLILLIVVLLAPFGAKAQEDIFTGRWYSPGIVNTKGITNNYLAELILEQKGKKIKGQFNYYFRDSLFTNEVECEFDTLSQYLFIRALPIIFHGSTSTRTGVDCIMRGEFALRRSKLGSFLGGKFTAGEAYRYTCPDILFDFDKSNDMENSFVKKIPDQLQKEPGDSLTRDSLYIVTQQAFNNRPKEFTKDIFVKSNVIGIELYDNGAIDYDSVSIFFNNNLILKKTMLAHVPIKLVLPFNKKLPFNELGMFANNVGNIPPNTATLVLIDGDDKMEFDLNSDLNRTATIKLFKKKEPAATP